MAKSAPDTKVEDVLSSVRRLVSEELPRNERPELPKGPGALVLTDAQRIESSAARIAGKSLEERIAELEAAVGDTANDDEFEPDGSEDQAMHRPDRIVYTRPPEAAESEEMRRNTLRLSQIALMDTGPVNETPDDFSDDVQLQFRRDVPGTPNNTVVDEAPMAEDVKETLTAAEVHIFTSPDDEIDRIEARLNGDPMPDPIPMQPVDAQPEESETVSSDAAQMTDADDAKQEDEVSSVAEAVQDTAEPQAEDTASSNETTERDDASVDANAAFEADLEEAVAASVESETEPSEQLPPPQEAGDKIATLDSEEDAAETAIAEEAIGAAVVDILDEEDLRPIVASLIREELQGELGERITRNVRKLVRREILRALAARDAE